MIEEMRRPGNRVWMKTISLVVTLSFLYQQVAWGIDFNSIMQKREIDNSIAPRRIRQRGLKKTDKTRWTTKMTTSSIGIKQSR